jgi:hypothetical protein
MISYKVEEKYDGNKSKSGCFDNVFTKMMPQREILPYLQPSSSGKVTIKMPEKFLKLFFLNKICKSSEQK